MSLSVNNNAAALNTYRNLTSTQGSLSKSLEKLSSGYRINRAADDAAGLAISEGLRSQISGLTQASRNAQDGINVVQTSEGALNEVHSILQRLNTLAVQAANDSNNTTARNSIDTESDQLVSELGRIKDATSFNGTDLLKGGAALQFQVGAGSAAANQIAVSRTDLGAVITALTGGSGTAFAAVTPTAVTGNLVFTNAAGGSSTVAMGAAGTYTSTQQIADKLNSDSTFSALFKASVDKDSKLVVSSVTGSTVNTTAPGTGVAAGTAVTGGIDLTTQTGAKAAIDTIATQITAVSTARANLGALQNRFEHTINNLNVSVENLTASESQIRDTDMADEMVKFTSRQILSQAGTAMLAQAKSLPQSILSLLQN